MRRRTPKRTSARSSASWIARSPIILGERVEVRPASDTDMATVQSIYAHHVKAGLASFQEKPPAQGGMRPRYHDGIGAGFPYLGARLGGTGGGYGYCSLYR